MQFLHRTVMPSSVLGHSCFRVDVNLVNIQKTQITIKNCSYSFKEGFFILVPENIYLKSDSVLPSK